jgi:S1-C subfamily serine protease
VTVRFAEEVPLFNQMVMRLPLRQPVTATVVRNGVEQTLTVTPVERESVEAPIHELATLGITGSNLTAWSSKELNRKTRDGVRVRGVRSGGPADDAKPALREDDIIVGVDDTPVKTLEGLTSALDHLVQNGNSHADALVSFERSGERLLTVVEIGRPGLEDPGLEARKAWIPISVQVLTRELADKLGLSDTSGVRVTRVLPGSAAKAGLQVGDIITAVDGDPVQASQPSDADLFATMIRQYKTGTNVELSIIRGKTPQKIKVALETSPRLPREMKKYEDPNFEFRVRDIAAADRLEEGIDPDQSGVLVDAVREGGWAALAHLAVGDLLLAVDGEAVQDVAAVQAKMTKIAAAHPPTVVFRVKRGIRTFFVEMQAGWKQQE